MRALIVVGLISTLVIGTEAYFLKHYISQNAVYKTQLDQQEKQNKSLSSLISMNDKVSLDVCNNSLRIDKAKVKLLSDVDNITNKVAKNEVTTKSADNAYLNSMQSAYCEATGSCSPKRSSN